MNYFVADFSNFVFFQMETEWKWIIRKCIAHQYAFLLTDFFLIWPIRLFTWLLENYLVHMMAQSVVSHTVQHQKTGKVLIKCLTACKICIFNSSKSKKCTCVATLRYLTPMHWQICQHLQTPNVRKLRKKLQHKYFLLDRMHRDRCIQRQLAAAAEAWIMLFVVAVLRGGQSTTELIAAQTFVIDTYITNIYIRQWREEGEGANGATALGIQRVKFKKFKCCKKIKCCKN